MLFAAVKGIPAVTPYIEDMAFLSAEMRLGDAAGAAANTDALEPATESGETQASQETEEPQETETEPETEASTEPVAKSQDGTQDESAELVQVGITLENRTPAEGEKGGDIEEKKYDPSGSSYIKSGNVSVQNQAKSYTVDIDETLAQKADLKVAKDGKPYVLIYHTHTTESYLDGDYGWYPKSYTSRSLDENNNMIAVGNEIVKQLEAAGYTVIHDTELYDYPSYNGAYDRTAEMIDKYMEEYPTLEVLLDIHRDAIQYDSGTKVKPTAVINNKKAAQMMIISGCEEQNVSGFPDWKYNLRFALQIQKAVEDKYPGLMRPVFFCARKYNMHKSHNSLLIEMGTDANTIDEAKYSGSLLGDALVDVLDAHC